MNKYWCLKYAAQLRAVCERNYLQLRSRNFSIQVNESDHHEKFAILRPYMNFGKTLANKTQIQKSITQRKLAININTVLEKYEQYQKYSADIKDLESSRELIANKLKKTNEDGESNRLREEGIKLRDQLKLVKSQLRPIEADFISLFNSLPNILHSNSPNGREENIVYQSALTRLEHGESHLKYTKLIRFYDNSCYYLMKSAATFDTKCTYNLTNFFAKAGFLQTANPDFVRRVLLEANATSLDYYHLVEEKNLPHNTNSAYLTGGSAYESFLGAVTKLTVYPTVLPLRFVSAGRSYNKTIGVSNSNDQENLFTATQTNTVQTFVATKSADEADQEFDNILSLVIKFYTKLGIHFKVTYANATELSISECLRAVIKVYSPSLQCYVSVGHISNYSNFVSKRILFSMKKNKDNHFLYLIGGPVMYTTRLIAALIENGISLDNCNIKL